MYDATTQLLITAICKGLQFSLVMFPAYMWPFRCVGIILIHYYDW